MTRVNVDTHTGVVSLKLAQPGSQLLFGSGRHGPAQTLRVAGLTDHKEGPAPRHLEPVHQVVTAARWRAGLRSFLGSPF